MNAWRLLKSNCRRCFLMAFAIAAAFGLWASILSAAQKQTAETESLPWIGVSKDGQHFVELPSQRRFVIWGVNYDHDRDGRLLDEYWDQDWETVLCDFAEIKALGANCVRIDLQVS